MEIRSATICFSKERSKLTNTRDKEIKRLLEEINTVICYSNNLQGIEKELKNYDNLKKELEEIYDHRGQAAMFPSKCRWVEQGERPSKYFFNLERGNYSTAQRKVTTLSRDVNRVARYAILVARDATFVAREALKTVSFVA